MAEGLFPEDGHHAHPPTTLQFLLDDEPIKEKKLTFEEASKCLNTLGKDESGIRYAYLMLSAPDRRLTDISIVLHFRHVLFVDFSGNFLQLEALQVLAEMPFLVMIKAEANRLDSAALIAMPYLQVLVVNRNAIGVTCDILQPMLETLHMDHNQIFTAQFDSERLPNLKELNLYGNHLIDLSGSYPRSLEKLYVGGNNISKINRLDLSQLTHLTILHLRGNRVRKLDGFSEYLVNLTYLNIRDNKINKLRQFHKLKCLPKLEILIFVGNPVYSQSSPLKHEDDEEEEEEMVGEDAEPPVDVVRIGVLVLLPRLKRINKEAVTWKEREVVEEVRERKLGEIMGEESSEEESEGVTGTEVTTEYTTETESEEKEEEEVVYPTEEEDDD